MASNCKTIRAEIEEARGAAWLSRAAETHVGACAACLEFMGEREKLRRLVGGLERVEAPGDFEFRLRARMAAAREAQQRPRFFLFRPANGLATLALAATIAASGYYVNRTTPTAVQPSSQQPTAVVANETAPPQGPTKVVNLSDVRMTDVPPPVVVLEKSAGVRPSKQERRRTAVASRVPVEPRGNVAKEVAKEVVKTRDEGALEFGLRTSPVIKGTNVKVEVTSEPLRVVMRDEHGTRRRLAMNPVSFGAQSPVGKRRKPAPLGVAENEGVW